MTNSSAVSRKVKKFCARWRSMSVCRISGGTRCESRSRRHAARCPFTPCSSARRSKRIQSRERSKAARRRRWRDGEAHSTSADHSLRNEAMSDGSGGTMGSDMAMELECSRLAGLFRARATGEEIFGFLLSRRCGQYFIAAATAADVDSEALDLLVEGGERDEKTLGGFGLVPAGAFQHINNDATLDLVHDLKQGRLRIVGRSARTWLTRKRRQKFRKLQAHTANNFLAANAFWKQVCVHAFVRREDDRA